MKELRFARVGRDYLQVEGDYDDDDCRTRVGICRDVLHAIVSIPDNVEEIEVVVDSRPMGRNSIQLQSTAVTLTNRYKLIVDGKEIEAYGSLCDYVNRRTARGLMTWVKVYYFEEER